MAVTAQARLRPNPAARAALLVARHRRTQLGDQPGVVDRLLQLPTGQHECRRHKASLPLPAHLPVPSQ